MKICNCWNDNLTLGHLTPANNSSITGLWEWINNQQMNNSNNKINCKTPTLKEKFISDYEKMNGRAKYIVVALQLANKEVEVIVNSYDLRDKYNYYVNMTYDNFEFRNNCTSKVVGYMIV